MVIPGRSKVKFNLLQLSTRVLNQRLAFNRNGMLQACLLNTFENRIFLQKFEAGLTDSKQ